MLDEKRWSESSCHTSGFVSFSESSLDGLDTFVVGISSQISTLDEEISKAVQAQSVAGKQASKVNRDVHDMRRSSDSNRDCDILPRRVRMNHQIT